MERRSVGLSGMPSWATGPEITAGPLRAAALTLRLRGWSSFSPVVQASQRGGSLRV